MFFPNPYKALNNHPDIDLAVRSANNNNNNDFSSLETLLKKSQDKTDCFCEIIESAIEQNKLSILDFLNNRYFSKEKHQTIFTGIITKHSTGIVDLIFSAERTCPIEMINWFLNNINNKIDDTNKKSILDHIIQKSEALFNNNQSLMKIDRGALTTFLNALSSQKNMLAINDIDSLITQVMKHLVYKDDAKSLPIFQAVLDNFPNHAKDDICHYIAQKAEKGQKDFLTVLLNKISNPDVQKLISKDKNEIFMLAVKNNNVLFVDKLFYYIDIKREFGNDFGSGSLIISNDCLAIREAAKCNASEMFAKLLSSLQSLVPTEAAQTDDQDYRPYQDAYKRVLHELSSDNTMKEDMKNILKAHTSSTTSSPSPGGSL